MTAATLESLAGRFRTCPTTGLKVDRTAQRLINAFAVAAVVSMIAGVIGAFALVLTRWQAVHLLPADWYYRMLTVHGVSMLIFFIIFFEMAVLYFAGPVLLSSRAAAPKLAWTGFLLMAAGAVLVEVTMWTGHADVLFTSYPPLKADQKYYLGIILFAVGALLTVSLYFANLVVAKREKTYTGSVPLVTFGATTAAVIAVITLLHGAAIYIPTWLWALGVIGQPDPEVYRMVWWGLGHSSQQINVAAMISIWYLLGGLTVGAVVINEKVSRSAFFLYVLFISMASAHHLLVDPGFGPAWKIWNTSYAMYLAVLASMVHGFTVPAGIEVGQRLRGYTKGMFEWLVKAPWGDPGFSAMIFSIILFGFIGGITGVTFGTEQINIIAHNTLRVPGHFHATVVAGTALAFMGATYYVIPLVLRKQIAFWPVAKIQPYLFAIGMALFTTSMTFAGTFGVPRRHYDITFPGAALTVQFSPAVDLLLAIMGIGGILAATSATLYIVISAWSVFFGKSLPEDAKEGMAMGFHGVPQGVLRLPKQVHGADAGEAATPAHEEALKAKGTYVLVGIFLLAFVVYYFVNWKLLSFVWKVG
ncbi:MAG: cbb3-type cytochrome c oxidase subunit I [Gemmatimonadota bacterium]